MTKHFPRRIRAARWFLSAAAALGAVAAYGPLPARGAGPSWPQWRGPKRDGKAGESGLLQDWPEGGPTLAWKAKEIGGGYSSVTIADGRIFTMGDVGDSSFVEALELDGGKKIWSAKVGKPGGGGGYPGPRCSPTIDANLVFALGQEGDLVCVEAATGKEIWRKNLTADFNGTKPHWGYAESVLVDGPRVICTPGGPKGTMIALNKETGEPLWRSEAWKDAAQYSSPIAVDHGGVRQYIQLTQDSVAGIAAETGAVLWKAERKGATAVIPTPIFSDGFVYVTSGYGIGSDLFKITAEGGKFSAEPVYTKSKVMVNHHGGVILLEGKVYGFSDNKGWTCQDFKTGDVVWKEKGKVGKGAIAYADGRFYLRDEGSGVIALIEASPAGYKEHGHFEQPDRSKQNAWPHPVIAGGKLYLRDQDTLLCYDIKAK